MHVTKLQKKRIAEGLTIELLAIRAVIKSPDFQKEHLMASIERIESNIACCPKPRKTYEWQALAKALNCDVADIYE